MQDEVDNCTLRANSNQIDTDQDGIGNVCDTDLNNDCVVNVIDLGLLRTRFFGADPDADFNGDAVVNVIDLGAMRSSFFNPPGPSASDFCRQCTTDPWADFSEGTAGVSGDGLIVNALPGESSEFEFDALVPVPEDGNGLTLSVYPLAGAQTPTIIQPSLRVTGTDSGDGCSVSLGPRFVVLTPPANGVNGYAASFSRSELENGANDIAASQGCGNVRVGDLVLDTTSVFSGRAETGTLTGIFDIDAIGIKYNEFDFPCNASAPQ